MTTADSNAAAMPTAHVDYHYEPYVRRERDFFTPILIAIVAFVLSYAYSAVAIEQAEQVREATEQGQKAPMGG